MMENRYERRLEIVDWIPERGNFGKEYKDSKEKELYLSCECGTEALKLNRFIGEEDYYLTVFKYKGSVLTFFARFKMAWKVLRGKGINTSEIVLSKKNWDKLKKF